MIHHRSTITCDVCGKQTDIACEPGEELQAAATVGLWNVGTINMQFVNRTDAVIEFHLCSACAIVPDGGSPVNVRNRNRLFEKLRLRKEK
jgi:hypothetical protein